MNQNSVNFANKNIEKKDFYNKNKKTFNIDDVDVNKILFSKKEQYGKYNSFKYFFGYNDHNVIRQLCLFIRKTTGYNNIYEKKKLTMTLMVKDKHFLENYKKIRRKIEKLIRTDFESRATYVDKYINT